MSADMFRDVTHQIVALGFSHIWLTPMLGEIFADPHVLTRFAALDEVEELEGYSFYSNFVLPRAETIIELTKLRKLDKICISIYGLDEQDFTLTTRKPASQFAKLLENLECLYTVGENWRLQGGLSFSIRTRRNPVDPLDRNTPLAHLLKKFRDNRAATISTAGEYDSWGGSITREDMAPLGLDFVDGRYLYMHGSCIKVFSEVQILADGRVHACACRDVDGSLLIGDLKDNTLAHVLSWENEKYRAIIESQMRGKFNDNCRSCASYRSVYDDRAARADPLLQNVSYDVACRMLSSAS